MNPNKKVTCIVVLGVLLSFALPHIITLSVKKNLKTNYISSSIEKTKTKSEKISLNTKKDTAVPNEVAVAEEPEEIKEPQPEEVQEPQPEEVQEPEKVEQQNIPYEEMTDEDLINSINSGAYKLEYSALYEAGSNRLSKSKGAIYYSNHKETYYSEKVLPGTSLNIPGRHVAEDGTVRDGDGYICVAANSSYLAKGTIVKTSLGPAKVYDSGCASGTVDIYTSW